MDAFTNRADKLGIPNLASGAVYQRFVHNLHVVCNVPGVATGDVPSGNIEFWPYNYSGGNALGIPGADTVAYDFGDACSFSANYSCMQVHNYSAGQTVFALNHWSSGSTIEVGIGNQPTGHPDWTFSNNGGTFTVKTLYVLVRRDASDTTPPTPVSAQADFSRQLVTVSFSEPLATSSADPRLFALDHGVATLGATLEADRRTVRLLTSRQPAGTALTLTITGVRDASPNANAVVPGTTLPVDAARRNRHPCRHQRRRFRQRLRMRLYVRHSGHRQLQRHGQPVPRQPHADGAGDRCVRPYRLLH
jgi:hypothetical protein